MGGPMGVYETDRHPWIPHELERLSARIAADRPTLGVCLGSQMMAAAMGADVYPGPAKEVGSAPAPLTDTGRDPPLGEVAHNPPPPAIAHRFRPPENMRPLAANPH